MIKQEPNVQAGTVGQDPGFTEGAKIVHLDGEVHRAGDYEVAAHKWLSALGSAGNVPEKVPLPAKKADFAGNLPKIIPLPAPEENKGTKKTDN